MPPIAVLVLVASMLPAASFQAMAALRAFTLRNGCAGRDEVAGGGLARQ